MVTIQTLTALYLGLYYTAVHLKLALVQPLHIRDFFTLKLKMSKLSNQMYLFFSPVLKRKEGLQ